MRETTIPISTACIRVYVAAAKLLRRRLGARAPDAIALIRFELSNRDARLIADDYLENNDVDGASRLGQRRRLRYQERPAA